MNVRLSTKLGGQTGRQPKIWGVWPTQPPLEPLLFSMYRMQVTQVPSSLPARSVNISFFTLCFAQLLCFSGYRRYCITSFNASDDFIEKRIVLCFSVSCCWGKSLIHSLSFQSTKPTPTSDHVTISPVQLFTE